ncbi:glycosyltransferase family 61 protein [Hymenobacter sp. B1770]|uniref:glycosyltransferase family 61 protein n=1 Tax=Hymenobacter sp. B1770 TaxID=1718788 RepID=UPI003CF86CED
MASVPAFLNKVTRSILWRTGIGHWLAANYWQSQEDGEGFRFLCQDSREVFANIPARFVDLLYSGFIGDESKRWSLQKSFVLEVSDVLLEPERLLGTRSGMKLVQQTVIYKYARQFPFILPHLTRPNNPTRFEKAIWYDGSATRNYYHYLVDALINLQQRERSGLPDDTPVLITRKMYEQIYFQNLYQLSAEMQQLNWYVVGDKEWVQVDKLYKFQTAPFDAESWQRMRAMYVLPNRKPWRKVFLNCDRKKYGRYLTNENEVVHMLKELGFEEVFAEHLTIDQQAQLFQDTEYLVALTGAGLIQQFFMNYDHGHVIEIMPRNRLMPEYYWQAYTLGMKYYHVVVGGNMRDGKDYPVETEAVKSAVVRMLDNKQAGKVYGLTELPMVHFSS